MLRGALFLVLCSTAFGRWNAGLKIINTSTYIIDSLIFYIFTSCSFSVVSTPIFASKHSFFSMFRDLQDVHSFAPLQPQQFSKCSSTCLMIFDANFVNFGISPDSPFFEQIFMKFCVGNRMKFSRKFTKFLYVVISYQAWFLDNVLLYFGQDWIFRKYLILRRKMILRRDFILVERPDSSPFRQPSCGFRADALRVGHHDLDGLGGARLCRSAVC